MSISTAATNLRASDRFMLVRLTPARYVSGDLAADGGGVYSMAWTYPIAKVERNGTVLTETTTNPPGTNDYWYHDESSGTFKVKLASAPSSTNVVVIYYYLFYTNQKAREAYETPTDSATTLRDWEPRLTALPTITQSIRNVTSGVFSVSASGLELINSDYAFQNYLTANDSFRGKDVDIWLCVNDTSEIQKVFKGAVDSLSLSEGFVSISFLDLFSTLDQPCYMGDTAAEAFFTRTEYPTLAADDEGVPRKYVAGGGNRCVVFDNGTYIRQLFDGEEAVNISSSVGGAGDNLTWGLCRIPPGGIKNQSFGSITRTTFFAGGQSWAYVSNHTFSAGETLQWVELGVTYRALILYVEEFIEGGLTYNLAISDISPGRLTTSSTIAALPKIALALKHPQEGVAYPGGYAVSPLQYTDGFSISTTTTSGGNTLVDIVLVNTNIRVAGASLVPETDRLLYRVVPAADANHAAVLERLVEAAGLAINASTFSTATSALDADCRFTIPYFDEIEYKTYTEYAEDLLSCTLGAVYQNSSQEVAYELLDSEAGAQTIDRHVYLKGSLSASVDYNDVVTQIVAYNPHAIELNELDAADPSSATSEDLVAKYLHGAKTTRFRHLMTSLANRIDAILAVRSSPRILYRFETATKNLTSLLNDPITLEADAVLGGSGTKDLSVVTIDNSGTSTVVEALDLESLA